MNKNKKKGFTLVELLAVIVILAIILVIAVPKIMETIKNAKIGSMESSAKLIAKSLETNYQVSLASGEGGTLSLTGSCLDAKIADIDLNEYESCTYTITDGKAKVTLKGKDSGKFSGLVCKNATKVSATCSSDSGNNNSDSVYCSSGEIAASVEITNETLCLTKIRNYYSQMAFDGANYNELTSEQLNEFNISFPFIDDICDDGFSTQFNIADIVNQGGSEIFGVSEYSTIKYYCDSENTLSKNYLTTMNITKSNINKIEFKNKNEFDSTGLTGVDVSQLKDNSVIGYYNCISDICTLTFVSENAIKLPKDSSLLFDSMTNLTNIEFNDFVDTSDVVSMADMFFNCSSLSALDLSSFNTSSATNMACMFQACTSLETLNINNFNTSNVINMLQMFNNCSSLETLDLSSFDTSKVTNMSLMFAGCSKLTTDLSIFDTSKVTNMSLMFVGCSKLTTTLEINNNVTNYSAMLSGTATESGSQITLKGTSEYSSLIDNMIATGSGNIVKQIID